ncbi:MAG: hypothetical protein V1743_04805 [Nanoarchaeota archaeon]
MKRDSWDATHYCTHCHARMKKKELVIEGIKVRGWECPKCHETTLHSEDAQRMLVFNKLQKGLSIKVGSLGDSLIIRFPKEATDFYDIAKGKNVILKAKNYHSFGLEIES